MLWYFLLILFLAAEMLTRLELVKSKLMFSRDAQVRLLFQLDITLSKRAATEEEASFYLVYYQIHRSKCCFHCLSGKRGVLPVCFQRYFVAELVVWAFFPLQLHVFFSLSLWSEAVMAELETPKVTTPIARSSRRARLRNWVLCLFYILFIF